MSAVPEPKLTYRGKFVVRTLGSIFVGVCCGMIVLGETFLKDDLRGPVFILYWTWCFLVTLLAGITAVVDMVFVRRAGRRSRRELFQREFTGKE